MITLTSFLLAVLTMSISTALNPMKTIYLMMALSMTTAVNMTIHMSTSWSPLIIFLLFMGGILISFMIMASMLPNEKSMKMKFISSLLLTMPILMLAWGELNTESASFILKTIISSSMSLTILIPLMISYFVVFILLISQTSAPLRTMSC